MTLRVFSDDTSNIRSCLTPERYSPRCWWQQRRSGLWGCWSPRCVSHRPYTAGLRWFPLERPSDFPVPETRQKYNKLYQNKTESTTLFERKTFFKDCTAVSLNHRLSMCPGQFINCKFAVGNLSQLLKFETYLKHSDFEFKIFQYLLGYNML